MVHSQKCFQDENRTMPMGWLGSTRSRILAWLIGLICLATAGSILAARQILLLQIYDRIDSALAQEIEEFQRLGDGLNPSTGEPFGDDIGAVFDIFLARSVPEDDEFFLALLDGEIYASSPIALPEALQFDDSAIARWSTLTEVQRGRLNTPVETLLYKAYPTQTSTGVTGVFVVAFSLTNRRQELGQVLLIMSAVMGCAFILALIDGGEVDDKLVAVPASSIDPTYDSISDISDMPEMELERLEEFFNVYKRLPQGSDVIELRGFGDASEAQAMVRQAIDSYVAQ